MNNNLSFCCSAVNSSYPSQSQETGSAGSQSEKSKKFVTNGPDIPLYIYTGNKKLCDMYNVTRKMVFLIEEFVDFLKKEELIPQAFITALFLLFLLLAA